MDLERPFLIIPDCQAPFQHQKTVPFLKHIANHYKIPSGNILNVGDETDGNFAGLYPKDPNATFTANGEIRAAQEFIAELASIFPNMLVCESNHGARWVKKATMAEIPEQLMRSYKDIFRIPETWRYAYKWTIPTKNPFQLIHGVELSGRNPYRQAAEFFSVSTAFGHLHSSAGIAYVETVDKRIWGFNTGSLIDREQYAFKYAKGQKFKANLGCGVIFNEGSTPLWIPLDSF